MNFNRRRTWPLVLFSFVFILAFQNCSRTSFKTIDTGNSVFKSNNGELYGGKPEANFYRFVPDFTCEEKSTFASALEIFGGRASLIENKKNQCGATNQIIDLNLVDTSIFQREIVGYEEGIFEGSATTPDSIPANLVEIWCRDRNDDQAIETVTHFDRDLNLAVNRIYYAENARIVQTPDAAVARTLTSSSVQVRDDSGFNLIVYRDQPATQLGLFKGHLDVVVNKKNISRETFCRLGGTLDPRIWPARQIVDLNIGSLILANDRKSFAFTSGISPTRLVWSMSDGSVSKPIGQALNFQDLYFSADSSFLYYSGDFQAAGQPELFKFRMDSKISSRVSAIGDDVGFFSKSSPFDSSAVFLANNFSKIASSANGGAPLLSSLDQIFSFDIASSGKIVFAANSTSPPRTDLYSIGPAGSGLIKLTPSSVGSEFQFDGFTSLTARVSGGGEFAVATASNQLAQFKVYSMALDGSDFFEWPVGQKWISSSSRKNKTLMVSSEGVLQLVDLERKMQFALPQLNPATVAEPGTFNTLNLKNSANSIFFSKDVKNLIAKKPTPAGQFQAIQISTIDASANELCPGLKGDDINVTENNENEFFVAALNHQTQTVKLFKKMINSNCTPVNSVVFQNSNFNYIRKISISPDQKKALVVVGANHSDFGWIDEADDIFYVPLDGLSPYTVSMPVSHDARVTVAEFLPDSKFILFGGNQIRLGETNLFLWPIPTAGPK